jgi:CxxC-x17-CxxC domain-containing protein
MERRFNSNRKGGNFGGPREEHDAVCAECKKACKVPFKPSGNRPVYCTPCHRNRNPQRRF